MREVGGISVGADFGWIPRGALTSGTPFRGTHGFCGCDDDWTEGAHVHLSTDAGLANSFYSARAVPHGGDRSHGVSH